MHNLPNKGLSKGLHTFFSEKLQAANYMRAMGISQSWAMFAPNPHRSNLFMRVLVKDKDLENTLYRFQLASGETVEVKGNEEIEYDGEMHSAANLYDALKEGYYGKF